MRLPVARRGDGDGDMKPCLRKKKITVPAVLEFSHLVRFRAVEMGSSDGHGGYDFLADQFGKDLLTEEITSKHQHAGLRGEALKVTVEAEVSGIFSRRLEQNQRSWAQEVSGEPLMQTEYEIVEIDGVRQLYHPQFQTTLRQMLENSREYQRATGKTGIFFASEAQALLRMEQAIVNGQVLQAINPTQHETGIKYFGEMSVVGDAKVGSKVRFTYLDAGKIFGRNLRMDEVEGVFTKLVSGRTEQTRINAENNHPYLESQKSRVTLEETIQAVRSQVSISNQDSITVRMVTERGDYRYVGGESSYNNITESPKSNFLTTVARPVTAEINWGFNALGTLATAEFFAWQKMRDEKAMEKIPTRQILREIFGRVKKKISKEEETVRLIEKGKFSDSLKKDERIEEEQGRNFDTALEQKADILGRGGENMEIFLTEKEFVGALELAILAEPSGVTVGALALLVSENVSLVPDFSNEQMIISYFGLTETDIRKTQIIFQDLENGFINESVFQDSISPEVIYAGLIKLLAEETGNNFSDNPKRVDEFENVSEDNDLKKPLNSLIHEVFIASIDAAKNENVREKLKDKPDSERALWLLGVALVTILQRKEYTETKQEPEVGVFSERTGSRVDLKNNKGIKQTVIDRQERRVILSIIFAYTYLALFFTYGKFEQEKLSRFDESHENKSEEAKLKKILLERPYVFLAIIRYLTLLREGGVVQKKKKNKKKKTRKSKKIVIVFNFPKSGLIYLHKKETEVTSLL
jgi:hypothetical protein